MYACALCKVSRTSLGTRCSLARGSRMSIAEVANGSKSRETPGKDALPARVFHIDSASSIWAQIGPGEMKLRCLL